MPVTPASLPRHELVGLDVRVTAASNADLVGIEGRVVTETTQTLGIEGGRETAARSESGASDATAASGDEGSSSSGGDRVYHVPKDGTTFTFELASGEAVSVEGSRLVARPARRTENTGDSKWR